MSATKVPAIAFASSGPVAPQPQAVLEGVRQDWVEAAGVDLDFAHDTPQGQLVASQAAVVEQKNAEFLFLANQFDPDQAEGRWQDALAKIYFLERKEAKPTLVTCLCTGLSGTVISTAALVQSDEGDLFSPVQQGIIPASGQLRLQFRSVETGPVPAEAGTVNRIYKAVPGWDTVTNPEPGSLGRYVEDRLTFEERRRESVAKNGQGSVASIYGEIANLADVVDVKVRENTGPEAREINGMIVPGHGIVACVAGGTDVEIAQAIFAKKSGGCDMGGNTEHIVRWVDPYGDTVPYPVRFERPGNLAFRFRVALYVTTDTPADIKSRIPAAMVKTFYGQNTQAPGLSRIRMGHTVYASRFYGTVIAAGASDVVEIKIDVLPEQEGGPDWRDFIETRINQLPVLDEANVIVDILAR